MLKCENSIKPDPTINDIKANLKENRKSKFLLFCFLYVCVWFVLETLIIDLDNCLLSAVYKKKELIDSGEIFNLPQ